MASTGLSCTCVNNPNLKNISGSIDGSWIQWRKTNEPLFLKRNIKSKKGLSDSIARVQFKTAAKLLFFSSHYIGICPKKIKCINNLKFYNNNNSKNEKKNSQ